MLDWTDIDTVLLDMDGTLLDLAFDNFFWLEHLPRLYAKKHQISDSESTERLHTRFNTGVGTLNWYCLDHWSKQLDMDIAAMKHEVRHLVSLRPHVREFLALLHGSSRQVVMVTNAHRKTLEIKMEQVDLTPWFDQIVISHDLGLPKEDTEFWTRLQQITPFNPARTLLIDDTESVLASAKTYGIAHLLTLLQPDSTREKRLQTLFPGIHHFDEIMPTEECNGAIL